MYKLLAIAAAVATICTSAIAQVGGPSNDTFKAKNLAAICSAPSGSSNAIIQQAEAACISYFRGLTDGLFIGKTFTDGGKTRCMPTGTAISTDEAKQDFERYLEARPEAAENSAGVVASFAIISAHQCGSSN